MQPQVKTTLVENAVTASTSNSTQGAAFEMLMNAIGNVLGHVVHQLITSDPSLVFVKGWHGMTALHRACLIGDHSTVLMLVQANSDVNALTNFDESPLHYASKRGVPSIVHLLVQCGAKVDLRDKRGRGVLHHAAENGAVQVLKYYEDAFAMSFREVDANLQSPLHISCNLGHVDVCRFLMTKARSDLKQADLQGNLAIHLTAKEGHAHLTWLLLCRLGTWAIRSRNKQGFSPLDLALQNDKSGHKSAAHCLQKYQTKPDGTKVTGPLLSWYFLLCYPFVLFLILIIVTQVLRSYQYIAFSIAAVQVLIQVKGLTPRMPDISRWPNPFFVGFFCAGIIHTIVCFFCLMFIHVYTNVIFLSLTLTTIPSLLLTFYKLMVQDAGVSVSSVKDPQTGKALNLVDLCRMQKPNNVYCSICDIVNNKLTKHCKLCDACVHLMDHHCLFLMKCVARNNHVLFVWLIILALLNMCLFCLGFYIYISTLYSHLDYSLIARRIFHQEMWPFSLMILNAGAALWSANLLYAQYCVVSVGCTSYYGETIHREKNLTSKQKLENFAYFLCGKPLPYKNPFSPIVQEEEAMHII